MAADSSTLSMLGAGSSGPDLVSGGSPAVRPHSGPSAAGARSSTGAPSVDTSGGADGANASESQSGQSDGSSAASTGTRNSASGKGRSARSGNSTGAAADNRRSARSSGASQAGSTPPDSQGSAPAGANDFPAALAQSLAATTAGDGTTPAQGAGKPSGSSKAGDSPAPAKGHSATDPASSALTLLEQALAGALAGIQAATAVAGTTAASTNTAPAADGGAIGGPGKSGTATLDALLTQSLAADSKANGANAAAAGGASPAAAPATAGTAAAGLTAAAQLSSAPLAGSQQGMTSAGMAIASPVGTNAWTDELGAKVTWMAHQGIESASLHLSPEHLGPLQVSISVHNGQASVWFGAAQPDTRTALQQSLPQLRQLFASQGLTLADSGVSRDPPRGQSHPSAGRAAAAVSAIGAAALDSSDDRRISIARGLGLLDTYA